MARLIAVLILLVCAGWPEFGRAQTSPTSSGTMAGEIQHAIAAQAGPEPTLVSQLRQLYEARNYAPLWQLDAAAEERSRILQAALVNADRQGLDVNGLGLATLAGADAKALAERDVRLSRLYLRYAARLRPNSVAARFGPDWDIKPDPFDPVASLLQANDPAVFATLIRTLEPPNPQYRRLIEAFQHYTALAAAGGWQSIRGDEEVKLDGSDPRIFDLRARLAAEGYLPKDEAGQKQDDLVAAVREFQARHGLESDGRVGRKTLSALNVPAETRVQQIAANLERWRFMPRAFGNRYVVVNIADAMLELIENDTVIARMRTVVGDGRHPTPILAAKVNAIVLNPPWNVPRSIAVKEMLPKLRRDPGYLAANDMVVVERLGSDPHGLQIDWRQISATGFPFHIRQLPGPKNALGSIKFEIPNRFDVYLHDTPVKTAFKRSERGLSHGCVRLEQPADLARRLLPPPLNNPGELALALASGQTQRVPLDKPVPVYLLYRTAFVDDDGQVNFRNDLYGRDNIYGKPAIFSRAARSASTDPKLLASIVCPER